MTDAKCRPLTYADAGVDVEAAGRLVDRIRGVAGATHRPEVLAGVGSFSGLFKLGSYREPVLVASTDGVGTKLKVAALLQRFDTIGVDLVNQSVNDILTAGAEPLFFLDYLGSSTLSVDEKAEVIGGVAGACKAAGCALLGGETADLPGVYAPGDLDLVGFVVGVVERDALIDGSSIAAGDALLALRSSGLHTNGYSLVRRVFGVAIDEDAAAERERLARIEPDLGTTLGDALLTPHRSYASDLQPVLGKAKGIAHITQGGLVENVPRVLPDGLGARFDRASWDVPPLFRLIQRTGNIAEEEMWRTYNMGVGLVFAVDQSDVDDVRAAVPAAFVCGEVVRQHGDTRVTIE